jgi:hypothetical protein
MAGEDAVLGELREQTRWLRLLGLQALRPLLASALTNDKQRAAYEYSDGKRGTREVAKAAGVGAGTVSRWWSDWLAIGICSEVPGSSGRAQHLVALSALGLPLPGATSASAGGEE